ncbi:MAG: Nif3-like dinuclear metal center hexameric protein [Acutalibacteraceae bacterium]
MSTVSMIYGKLNSLAPFATQESWDNSGLLAGDPGAEVTQALVVLDITGDAVREAQELGAQLIVSHHPVIFQPLKKLESGSVAWELARAGISAISAHTNLDKARGGVNDCLAAALGLENVTVYGVEGREKHYKLTVFVPADHADAVRRAMTDAGAGTIGGYTGCTFSVEGTGRFLPERALLPSWESPAGGNCRRGASGDSGAGPDPGPGAGRHAPCPSR